MKMDRMPRVVRIGAVIALLAGRGPSAWAQTSALPTLAQETGEPPAQVLILGVFHFHNPNADYVQFEGIDVLTDERQREIEEVVARLEAFAPTRIALERPVAEADSLDARLARHRAGEFELTRNEIHQLGFRLAGRLGHDAVYPVDHPGGVRIDSLMAYAGEREPDLAGRFQAYIGEITALFDRMQREESILENLRFMNEPANIPRTHEPYAVQATLGAGDGYIGARLIADWYERNLAIFANRARVATRGERVLFIVGAGHVPILRELVTAHPDMALVEAVDYLR